MLIHGSSEAVWAQEGTTLQQRTQQRRVRSLLGFLVTSGRESVLPLQPTKVFGNQLVCDQQGY